MATIINNNSFTLTPEQQEIIRNAAANHGVDAVEIGEEFELEMPEGEAILVCPVTYEFEFENNVTQEHAFNFKRATNEIC